MRAAGGEGVGDCAAGAAGGGGVSRVVVCGWKKTQQVSGLFLKTIGATPEEFEETEFAEDLELLADFGADMGVVGMEFGQGFFEGVDFCESKFGFVESANGGQHVQSPSACFGFQGC